MKILHTSDWHLGRKLHDYDILDVQRHLLMNEIPATISRERPDLMVIAGDVYDRKLPSNDAVGLLDEFVRLALMELKLPVLLSAGNHDASRLLDFGSSLYRELGFHLHGRFTWPIEPLEINDEHGPVLVFALPYFDPRQLTPAMFGVDELPDSVAGIYSTIFRSFLEQADGRRAVLVGHVYVTGSEKSGSERFIEVGGLSSLPASLFDGFEYVALGHIHSAQNVVTSGRIRYSGSIYPYSVDEVTPTVPEGMEKSEKPPKSVTIVEIGEKGSAPVIREVELRPIRRVLNITGTLDFMKKLASVEDFSEDYAALNVLHDGTMKDSEWAALKSLFGTVLVTRHITHGAASASLLKDVVTSEEFQSSSPEEKIIMFFEKAMGSAFGSELRDLVTDLIPKDSAVPESSAKRTDLRLLRLYMHNFGPYKDAEVDFSRLKGRVFLIQGPNGAGKSTIFDAIFTALYDRSFKLKTKNTSAISFQKRRDIPPGDRAEVTLEFFWNGHTYRVSRYLEVGKRGGQKNANALLVRLDSRGEQDPGFEPITKTSSVTGWIKENLISDERLEKNMLIAQGRFRDFINDDESRIKLLEQMVDIGFFQAFVSGVGDKYDESKTQWSAERERFLAKANELGENFELEPLKDDKTRDGDASLYETKWPKYKELIAGHIASMEEDLKKKREGLEDLKKRQREARQRYQEALDTEKEFVRLEKLRKDAASLEERLPEMNARKEAVELYRRFRESGLSVLMTDAAELQARIRTLTEEIRGLETQLQQAAERLDRADKAAGQIPDLEKEQEEVSQELGKLETRLETAKRLEQLDQEIAQLKQHVTEGQNRRQKLARQLSEIGHTLDAMTSGTAVFQEFALSASSLSTRRNDLERTLELLKNAQSAGSKARQTEEELHGVTEEISSLEKEISEIQKEMDEIGARISELHAVELRQTLVRGQPCPVCGSTHHPYAESESEDDVQAPDVRQFEELNGRLRELRVKLNHLQHERDQKNIRKGGLESTLEQLITSRQEALTEAGLPEDTDKAELRSKMDEVSKELEKVTARLSAAEKAAEKLSDLEKEINRLRTEKEKLTQQLGELDSQIASNQAILKERQNEQEKIAREVGSTQALTQEQKRLEERRGDLKQRIEALRKEREDAKDTVHELKERLKSKSGDLRSRKEELENREKDISGRLQELDMTRDEAMKLQEEAQSWEQETEEIKKFFGEYDSIMKEISRLADRLEGHDRPDTDLLREELDKISDLVEEMNQDIGRIAQKVEGLGENLRQADELATSTYELFNKYKMLACIKEMMEGKSCAGVPNALGMEFIKFILSYYLSEMLSVSNGYLGLMSDGRYILDVTANGKDLKLMVTDTWNHSTVRPLNSLSGGESFMAALALAIGTLKMLKKEFGGGMDTLFIDEGFGALDEEHRQAAATILQDLEASSDFTLGFVTHVEQLKDMVPNTITVIPQGDGTSILEMEVDG